MCSALVLQSWDSNWTFPLSITVDKGYYVRSSHYTSGGRFLYPACIQWKFKSLYPQAIRRGDQDTIDNWLQLTENHSDLNAYDEEGFTVLHHAVKLQHGSIFKCLLDSGAGTVLDLANWYSTYIVNTGRTEKLWSLVGCSPNHIPIVTECDLGAMLDSARNTSVQRLHIGQNVHKFQTVLIIGVQKLSQILKVDCKTAYLFLKQLRFDKWPCVAI